MAYRFKKNEAVGEATRRIAAAQIERALTELDDDELSLAVKVHQVRKRCKKVRGLLRLVRPGLGKVYRVENAWLRDTARVISPLRDAETSWQTFRKLIDRLDDSDPTFTAIGSRLEQVAQEMTADPQQARARLQTVRERLSEQHQRVGGWSLQEDDFKTQREGLETIFAQAGKAMWKSIAQPTTQNLHAWRKEVKYHGYHCRLLEPLWPAMLAARGDEVGKLGDWLGEAHNLAVLGEQARQLAPGDQADAADGLEHRINKRRKKLRQKAWQLGKRLFAEKPRRFARRQRAYWRLWQAERD